MSTVSVAVRTGFVGGLDRIGLLFRPVELFFLLVYLSCAFAYTQLRFVSRTNYLFILLPIASLFSFDSPLYVDSTLT